MRPAPLPAGHLEPQRNRASYARRAVVAAGVFFCVAATLALHGAALDRRSRFAAEDDVLFLPRAEALRLISLGHHHLAADLIFVRALIYFGAHFHGDRQYRWLDNYLATIVALDPQWKTPYRWAGVATMYDGNTITNESVQRSSRFLELGAKQFPRDWELAFMLGCNYLFELKTDDPAQHEAWQRQGAEWVRHAALVGGAPSWVPLLAATILRKDGQEQAAMRHLEEVYLSTPDEATREEVRKRLVALHSQFDLAAAERERATFSRAWQRTVPYAPPDFFAVLGEAGSPRLDPAALAPHAALDADQDD